MSETPPWTDTGTGTTISPPGTPTPPGTSTAPQSSPLGGAVQRQVTPIGKMGQCGWYERTLQQVVEESRAVDLPGMNAAVAAWRSTSEALSQAGAALLEGGGILQQGWSGQAALGAQQQLQVAQATLSALAADCEQMAVAGDQAAARAEGFVRQLDSLASSASSPFNSMSLLAPGARQEAAARANQQAVDLLVGLMSDYNHSTFNTVPDQVEIQYVPVAAADRIIPGDGTDTGGGNPPGARSPAGGEGASPDTSSGRSPSTPPAGGLDPGSSPGGGTGPGTSPADGVSPPGAGSGVPAPGAGPGTGLGSGGSGSGGLGGSAGDPYAPGSQLAGGGPGGGLGTLDPIPAGPGTAALGSGLSGGLGAGGLGSGGLGAGGLGAGGLGSAAGLGAGGLGSAGLGASGLGSAGLGGGGIGAGGIGVAGGGAGSRGSGAVLRGRGVPGAGVVAGGPGGMPGLAGPGAGGAASGTARGGMGYPGGMPSGGNDQDRERSTWLTEDDDVWGLDQNLPTGWITE